MHTIRNLSLAIVLMAESLGGQVATEPATATPGSPGR